MSSNLKSSPLEVALQKLQQRVDAIPSELSVNIEEILAPLNRLDAAAKQLVRAITTVASDLPNRGWYLTGEEPITLVKQLAQHIEAGEDAEIDRILVEYSSNLRIDHGRFEQWLTQRGVPDCCIERVRIVLEHRDSEDHASATIMGIVVVDELCRHLYDGRDFTSKSGRHRPQLAVQKPGVPQRLGRYAREFLNFFGTIQDQTDRSRLDDETYFNRHAILHGQMRRSFGPMDSEKVFMALMILVFGLEETEAEASGP